MTRSSLSYVGVPMCPLSVCFLGKKLHKSQLPVYSECLEMFLLVHFRMLFILTEHLNSLGQVPFSQFGFLPFIHFFSLISIPDFSKNTDFDFETQWDTNILSLCHGHTASPGSTTFRPALSVSSVLGGQHRVMVKHAGSVAVLLECDSFPCCLVIQV